MDELPDNDDTRRLLASLGGFPDSFFAQPSRYISVKPPRPHGKGGALPERAAMERLFELARPFTHLDLAILSAFALDGRNGDRLHRVEQLALGILRDTEPQVAGTDWDARAQSLAECVNHDDVLEVSGVEEAQEHPTFSPTFSVYGELPWISGNHGRNLFSLELLYRCLAISGREVPGGEQAMAITVAASAAMYWASTEAELPHLRHIKNNFLQRDVRVPSPKNLRRFVQALHVPRRFLEETLREWKLPTDAWKALLVPADAIEGVPGQAGGFVEDQDWLLVLNPASFPTRVIHAVLGLVCREAPPAALCEAYMDIAMGLLTDAFAHLGTPPISIDLPSELALPNVLGAAVAFDTRRAMLTLAILDPLCNFDPANPIKPCRDPSEEAGIRAIVDAATTNLRQRGYDDVCLAIVIHQFARPMCVPIIFPTPGPNRFLLQPLQTFRDTSRSEEGNRFFWHSYAEAWTNLRAKQQRKFPDEDEVLAQYLDEGYRFPPVPFTLKESRVYPGLAADMRMSQWQRSAIQWFRSPIDGELWACEARYPLLDVPILVAQGASKETHRLEIGGLTLFIQVPYLEQSREGHAFSLLLCDILAYWLWQVLRKEPREPEQRVAVLEIVPKGPWKMKGKDLHTLPEWSRPLAWNKTGARTWELELGAWNEFSLSGNLYERQLAPLILELAATARGLEKAPDAWRQRLQQLQQDRSRSRIMAADAYYNAALRDVPRKWCVPIDEGTMNRVQDNLFRNAIPHGFRAWQKVEDGQPDAEILLETTTRDLQAELADVDTAHLLRQLAEYQETVVQRDAVVHLHAVHDAPCFALTKEWSDDLEVRLRNIEKSNVASRFLVEYLTALPPQSGRRLSELELHQLLALSFWHTNNATTLQAFRTTVREKDAYYIPGRGTAFTGKQSNADVQALNAMRTSNLLRWGHQYQDDYRPSDRDTTMRQNVRMDAANLDLAEEWGLTAQRLIEFNTAFTNHADSDEFGIYDHPEEKFRDDMANLGFTPHETEGILANFTLKTLSPSGAREVLVGDDGIWIHNRRRSYLHSAIIQHAGRIMIGARRLHVSADYIFGKLDKGLYRANTKRIKALMGTQGKAEGTTFEKEVRETFRQKGVQLVTVRPPRSTGIGAVDCAVLHNGTLYLMECKSLNKPLTPAGEQQVRDTLDKAVGQLADQAKWTEANLVDLSLPPGTVVARAIVISRSVYPSSRQGLAAPVWTIDEVRDRLEANSPMSEWPK